MRINAETVAVPMPKKLRDAIEKFMQKMGEKNIHYFKLSRFAGIYQK